MRGNSGRLHFLLALSIFMVAVMQAPAKEKPGPHIYSNVHEVEGGIDLVGTEIELTVAGNAASGVLRIYDGRCAEPVAVTGSASDNTIHVTGEGVGFGKVEVTARLQHGRLDGSLKLDRAHSTEPIRLKKIAKPHC
jgi:hypothetical protein